MTIAQRARLVVAMGLLNLILATVALTAGFVAPPQPGQGIAVASPIVTPVPTTPRTSAPASEPTPAPTATAVATPALSGEPEATPPSASAIPSSEPSPTAEATATGPSSASPEPTAPTASEPPIVAVIPTPTAARPATPGPTAQPTGRPTARPTPRATPTPTQQPVVGKPHRERPPCPGGTSGPPGHNKGGQPQSRPCGNGSDHGKGSGKSGVVVLLPLVLGSLVSGIRTRRGVGPFRRQLRARRPSGRAPRSILAPLS